MRKDWLKYVIVGLLLMVAAASRAQLTVPGASADLIYDGIDVSSYQKDIDWSATAQDKNIKFVYVKATEGATYRSRHYQFNIENARRHGILVGAYHFLRPNVPVEKQFSNFTTVVKKEDQDLIPLIDVEVRGNMPVAALVDTVLRFADMLEHHYGCKPMIYTGSAFYNSFLSGRISGYPLFIARYSKVEPRLVGGVKWVLWQFSEKGVIAGIDHAVDLCRFNKGCGLKDILIGGKHRSAAPPVRAKKEEPVAVAPKPSPKQEAMTKEQRKQAEKRKAEEKKEAERLAKQKEKLRKLKEKEEKEAAKQAQKRKEKAEKEAKKRAELEAKQRGEQAKREQSEREEALAKKNKERAAQKERTERQLQDEKAKAERQKKEQQEKLRKREEAKREQEKAAKKQGEAKKSKKQTNQSSYDNDDIYY